jgi:hypothetical protein
MDYESALKGTNSNLYNEVVDTLNDIDRSDEWKTAFMKQVYTASQQGLGKTTMSINNLIQTAAKQASMTVNADTASALAAAGNPTFESRTYTPEQVTALFEHIVIAEGLFDKFKTAGAKTVDQVSQGIKKGAGKAVGAVANKLQQVGHNITTKTTADKLQRAWKAAGSPTDSEAIIDLLTAQGIDKSVIAGAMKAVAPFATVDRTRLPDVSKLNLQQKQQLLKQLDAIEQGQKPTAAPAAITVPGTSTKSTPGAPVTQPTSAPKVVGVPSDQPSGPIAAPGGGATGLTVPGVPNTSASVSATSSTTDEVPAVKTAKPKVPYSAVQPQATGAQSPAVGKVSPARNPGAPTQDEYDKFQQKVQAAMKKQA